MFKNKFENTIYNVVLKNIVHKHYIFNITNNFEYYKRIREILDNPNQIRLYINAPKNYGVDTHTEMVVAGKGLNIRIDGKYQEETGNIQINNILGEIHKNVIENPLHEDKLIFVLGGKGIDVNEVHKINQYLIMRNIQNKVHLFTLNQFTKFIKRFVK